MKQFKEYDYDSYDEMILEECLYYKNLFYRCVGILVDTENLNHNPEADNYYHPNTGEYIDEGL